MHTLKKKIHLVIIIDTLFIIQQELRFLLPHLNIDMLLIGPGVSKKVDGKEMEMGNIRVTIQKGVYHQCKTENPDLVLGEW